MVELNKLVCKYSFEQLETLISNLDIDKLQNDMVIHGATKEELKVSAETFNDVMDYIIKLLRYKYIFYNINLI